MAVTKRTAAAQSPDTLHIPDGWTRAEVTAQYEQLMTHAAELRAEIATLSADIDEQTADAVGATGDDVADTGSRAFQREHDVQIVLNARDLLAQDERALHRMSQGAYGICEGCEQPIAKGRLQAHPGATLCVGCKTEQERR